MKGNTGGLAEAVESVKKAMSEVESALKGELPEEDQRKELARKVSQRLGGKRRVSRNSDDAYVPSAEEVGSKKKRDSKYSIKEKASSPNKWTD